MTDSSLDLAQIFQAERAFVVVKLPRKNRKVKAQREKNSVLSHDLDRVMIQLKT